MGKDVNKHRKSVNNDAALLEDIRQVLRQGPELVAKHEKTLKHYYLDSTGPHYTWGDCTCTHCMCETTAN